MAYANREPLVTDSLKAVFGEALAELHTALPAVIVSYDPSSKRAQVQPLFVRVYEDLEQNEVPLPYPVLTEVPVRYLRGGGAFLHMPLAAGDPVWLICAQSSIDKVLAGDGQTPLDPQDARHHHIADAFVLAGLVTEQMAQDDVSANPTDVIHGLGQGQAARFGTAGASDPVAKANEVEARLQALEQWAAALAITVATTGTASAQTGTGTPTPFTANPSEIASSRIFVDA